MSYQPENRFDITWGLQGPAYGKDLAEAISEYAAEGIPALEIMYAEYFVDRTDAEITAFRRAADEGGIALQSVHLPFDYSIDIAHVDEAVRSSSVQTLARSIRRVGAVGIGVGVIHPGRCCQKNGPITLILDQQTRSLDELLGVAEASGVRIGLENMLPDHPGDSAEDMARVLAAFDTPWLGAVLDTGHAHVCGDFEAMLDAIDDRVIGFHLADNCADRDWHFQPGYGNVPWATFFEWFESLNVTSPIIVEAQRWANGSAQRTLLELDALANTHLGGRNCYPNLTPPPAWLGPDAPDRFQTTGRLRCPTCTRLVVFYEDRASCACGESMLAQRNQ
jgi:sugar phosphate isomerase/epimerase